MIRAEHEFKEADANGNAWCIHCGARRAADMTATCLSRDVSGPDQTMPEPARRVPAAEDADTISRRLAELRAERQAAWDAEAEPAKYVWLAEYAARVQ